MDRQLTRAVLGEGIGTFLFVLIGVGCIVLGGLTGAPSPLLDVALRTGSRWQSS